MKIYNTVLQRGEIVSQCCLANLVLRKNAQYWICEVVKWIIFVRRRRAVVSAILIFFFAGKVEHLICFFVKFLYDPFY